MSDDIEKINEIFRMHDKRSAPSEEAPEKSRRNAGKKRTPIKAMDELFLDSDGVENANYTGDEESERDYKPVRQSHEYHSGCLGGLMYFVFIICLSVVFACVAWMAASDMLALNKANFTAVVTLPTTIFESETVDTLDENGKKIGTKRITHADMDYVADALKDAGLIEYKWLFNAFCKISTAETKVSPGEYELKSTYDYRALIQNMRAGSSSTVTVNVTLPEGFTMHQIFLRLEENGVSTYNELVSAAAGYNFNYDFLPNEEQLEALSEQGVALSSRLEGFLYPDTYEFYVGMQASSAISKLLDTFNKRFTDKMLEQADKLGLSVADVVNIASLIEKEAANDEERPIIASVIHNRLNIGMPLGIDSTVLYPYPDHEGAPTGTMLQTDGPYNSRLRLGLPPTAICSPGYASLNSALYPETTNYYYYALDTETGKHRFFTNNTEFDAFVATQNYE